MENIHNTRTCELKNCRVCSSVKWLIALKKDYPKWTVELRDEYMLNNEIGKMP